MPLDVQAPRTRLPWMRERLSIEFPDTDQDKRTHQSFAASADINNIMKRYERDGVIDHLNHYKGEYGDFTAVTDFHSAMNVVTNAQQMFMSLPAKIRGQFGNDPGAFLDYATDPENEDGMRELGLLPPQDHVDASEEPPANVVSEREGGTRRPEAAPASPSGVDQTGGSADGPAAE